MKKHLLKINLLAVVLFAFSFAPVQALNPVKTVELFYADGSPISVAGDIKLGSTIKVKVTTSTETGDANNYTLVFMQLGQLDNGVDKADAWINTYMSGGAEPAITNGVDQIIEFDFPVKTANNGGTAVLPAASLFRVSCRTAGVSGINQEFVDFAANFTAAGAITEITSLSYIGEPSVLLGSTIDFTLNYTITEDATYTLSVFQSGLTESSNGAVVYITGRTDYVLVGTEGSYTLNETFTTSAKKGTVEQGNVDQCVDGEGNFRFRIVKDGVTSGVDDEVKVVNFTTTSTSIVGASKTNFKVYPNPATSDLFVEGTEGSVIEICNIAGSLVRTQVATSNKQYISVANLAKGMYVVKVKLNGESFTNKLLIK